MSFTEKKFSSLSHDNKIKKIIFAIHKNIEEEKNLNYLTNLLNWYNKYENKNIPIPKTLWEWKILSENFLQKLKGLNIFIEKNPIDKKNINKKNSGINLLLTNIRSPHNVGAIIRNSDAFNVDKIYITGITPDPQKNPKIIRTSMGAKVEINRIDNCITFINNIKKERFKIYALEKTNNSKNIYDFNFVTPLMLILGNEEFGIENEVLNLCDDIIHIPMIGSKNSLNVSVASGIALFSMHTKKKSAR